MKFKVLDLFCGAGGFSSGLDQLDNFETVIGTDFDKYAINTFSKNFPKALAIMGDLSQEEIRNQIIKSSRELKVNMIIGGPPCQGFSLKGKNKGMDDPRNFLFLEYFKIVKELQPEIFIIENVKNILNSSNGYFKNEIINIFSDLGYIVTTQIVNAKNFGVPQSRERAIIIGSKTVEINIKPIIIDNFTSVYDAISDLNYLNSGEGDNASKYNLKPLSKYQEQLRKNSTYLYNHIATNHSEIALKKLMMIPPEGDKKHMDKSLWGNQQFSTTWARLKWQDISPTIDTRFDTPSNGRNSHPVLHRSITPREAARIQSFNDSFVFYGPKTSICRQIGNAVPPLMAKSIGEQITDKYDQYNKNKR
ncbi:DNA cytosine methyltransferase [Mycoplasma sp. VS299A]|uniref:DNA cytosine methyltransferase n=1 Tax=Mycoplasma sp. VS299A TaxID=3401690 RepID=UPI003AAEB7B7